MISRWLIIGSLIFTSTVVTLQHASAQDVSADSCQEAINSEIAKELRFHRAVVFGEIAPESAPIGHVKYDTNGKPWIKMEEDKWASIKEKDEEEDPIEIVFQNDDAMESDAEIEPRRGILDTKRTLTHELIPYLMQSMRALQCRTQAICNIALESMITSPEGGENAVEIVTVETLGCLPMFRSPINECRFPSEGGNVMASEQTGMLDYCPGVRDELLEREASLLKFVVEYDAAYRTMLQLAGNFDLMIQELRWPFTHTIRNVASILGVVSRIPCFLSTCDSSPIPFPEI